MSAQAFALEIDRDLARSNKEFETIIRKIALDGLDGVTLKTRVDTGRARGNWFVRIGSAGDEVTDDTDKDGSATINRGGAVIDGYQTETGYEPIAIYNNLPYILVLENGGANLAVGDKMVALTLLELQAQFA